MSKEQLGEFFQLVVTNVELQEEIKLALTAAAVVDIAKKQGFDVSVGDVLRKQAEAIADLSDSELENVSGGAWGMFLLKEAAKVAGAFLVAGGATIGVTKLIDTI